MKRPVSVAVAVILMYIMTSMAYAYSHLLNFPRIGDKMDISILSDKTVKTDSLLTTVDISGADVVSYERYIVWGPAPDDTISAMMVMVDREQKYLTEKNKNLYCHSVIKPGYVRYYKEELPCCIERTDENSFIVISEGRIDGVSEYSTHGEFNYSISEGFTLILPQSDSLRNVERINQRVTEKMLFGDSVVIHHSNNSEWYVPGYRYPVLSHQQDVMLTESNDTIDTNSRWVYIEPLTQADEIKNDLINESIRSEINNSKHKSPSMPVKNKIGANDITPPNIRWNSDRTIITVSGRSLTNEQSGEIILCDIQGRVYFLDYFTGDNADININVSTLNKGTYILYVGNDSEPVTYRFTI